MTDQLRKFPPLKPDHPLVRDKTLCPGCGIAFKNDDVVTLIYIGPGNDPEDRKKAREGRAYTAVAQPVHWPCATGEE